MAETTLQYYKNLMLELGIEPKKALGQNFLINDRIIEKIGEAAKDLNATQLLEIGPGLGALTRGLRALGKPLTLLELDRVFAEHWRKQGLSVIEGDALQIDWTKLIHDDDTVLVSNLPYQISSSIVIDRCLDRRRLKGMVLMFQKEVAQRIKASQTHDLYGMLSVVAQTFWDLELLVEAGPGDFYPPPKVSSRVLVFRRKTSPVSDPERYLRFVKACYSQPRKMMGNNLSEAYRIPRDEVNSWLNKHGFSEKVRPHQLTVAEVLKLYGHFDHFGK